LGFAPKQKIKWLILKTLHVVRFFILNTTSRHCQDCDAILIEKILNGGKVKEKIGRMSFNQRGYVAFFVLFRTAT
jgi:hypothetical protein